MFLKMFISKIKDESEGKIIDEFVGLKVKDVFYKKILMVKNPIQQKKGVLQLGLINSKTLYSTKKYSDTE